MSDPYYDQTVLFLPFEPVPGCTGNSYAFDFSSRRWPITCNVSGTKVATTDSKYGTGCWDLTTSYPYLVLPSSDNFALGIGNFTIEFWIKTASLGSGSNATIVGNASTALYNYCVWLTSGKVALTYSNGTTISTVISSVSTVNSNTWRHVAITRDGINSYVFIDGVIDSSNTTVNQDFRGSSAVSFIIGNPSNVLKVDEVRLTAGVARYTANFTPTQIPLADYPVPDFTKRNITHYSKAHFDFNSLPKTKRLIQHEKNSAHDFNLLPKGKRLIKQEKNSLRDWSLLSRTGKLCVEDKNIRNDFNDTLFGSLSVSNQGTIAGTISVFGNPVKRRVRLYESESGAFIREMWSGEDGTYSFTGLRKGLLYTVSSTDLTEQYNDVIGTNISPI